MKHGVVVEFDAHVGLGVVRDDDGHGFAFHCTQIADGTRTISTGTGVNFEVVAGPLGRWEAANIAATQ